MNAIIGMSTLLLDTPLESQQREFLQIVRTSSDALLAIINDILDFSKIESGRIELERRSFSVRDCVEEALGVCAVRAAPKRARDVVLDRCVRAPSAWWATSPRLRQILLNLLSNAVKFTQEGEVCVDVRLGPAPVPTASARCSSRCETPGSASPADRMDRLFRSFSQVDASTTRQFGGTGLGLAISKRLGELMGGRMWVESQVGRGSTFSFTIVGAPGPAEANGAS